MGVWDPAVGALRNAIVDDELHAWINAIAGRGASVCAVFDTCHSGTLLRSPAELVTRDVPATELIPAEAIAQARQAAGRRSRQNGHASESAGRRTGQLAGKVVGIYAARSDEKEIEKLQPAAAGGDFQPYGLLTYTLCQTLLSRESSAAKPLSYRQLVQRVQRSYLTQGMSSPTPLVEGPDADREFLGLAALPGGARFELSPTLRGWRIDGGALHGLTPRSVLAVYAHDQAASTQPIGYLSIERVGGTSPRSSPARIGVPKSTTIRPPAPCVSQCTSTSANCGSR